MALWDFLKNIGNKIGQKDAFADYAQNMPALQPAQNNATTGGAAPLVTGLQLNDDGTLYQTDIQPENKQKSNRVLDHLKYKTQNRFKNFSLSDALLGKQAQATDNIGSLDNDTISAGISASPRQGGLLNDIISGAKENFNNRFETDNLANNIGSDGRKKGIAYRIGEGLGTIGRIAESPLGRGLLTAGIIGATGGGALPALTFGGVAGVKNQGLRNNDKMYRQQMIQNAQNSLINSPGWNTLSDSEKMQIANQLQADMFTGDDGKIKDLARLTDDENQQYTTALQNAYDARLKQNQQIKLDNIANQINGLRGYVTDDMYKNMIQSQQLRDNADWKRAYFDNEQKNRQEQREDRKAQFEYNKIKDAEDRDFRNRQLASQTAYQNANLWLGYAKLAADKKNNAEKQSAAQKDAQSTLNQIQMIRDLINANPGATGLSKGFMTGDLLNRVDSKRGNIETRVAIDALRTKIRHDLTGAQFSPKEAREYEKFLPNIRDSKEIIEAKLDALERRYRADFGISLGVSGNNSKATTNNNPLGLNL